MHVFSKFRKTWQRQDEEDRRLQKVIAEAAICLSGNAELLCLTGQGLGNYAARLGKVLATNKSLRVLQLDKNGIGDAAVAAIVKALTGNSTLQHLDLDFNAISDIGAAKIAGALKENQGLRVLDLHCNKIGGAGTEKLAKALETNPALRTLSLHGNVVGDVGTGHLARALEVNTVLRELFLGKNAVGNDGATQLAIALAGGNGTLRELHLETNIIKDEGALHLAGALATNSALQELWLLNNHISGIGLSSFAEALRRNTTLQRLGITANCKADDGASAQVLESLKRNHAMKRALRSVRNGDPVVDLAGHVLDDVSGVSLASAIESSHTLRELRLSRSSTWGNTGALLTKALEENFSLEKVSIIDDDIHSRSCTFDSVGGQTTDIRDPSQVLLIPGLDDVCDEHQAIKSDNAQFLRLARADRDDNKPEHSPSVGLVGAHGDDEDVADMLSVCAPSVPSEDECPFTHFVVPKTLPRGAHAGPRESIPTRMCKGEHPDETSQEPCSSRGFDSSSDSGSESVSVISKGLPLPLEGAVPGTGIGVEAHVSNAAKFPQHLPAALTATASCSRESDLEVAEENRVDQELLEELETPMSSDSESESESVISKGLSLPLEGAAPGTGIGVEAHVSDAAKFPQRLPAVPTATAGSSWEIPEENCVVKLSDLEIAKENCVVKELSDLEIAEENCVVKELPKELETPMSHWVLSL